MASRAQPPGQISAGAIPAPTRQHSLARRRSCEALPCQQLTSGYGVHGTCQQTQLPSPKVAAYWQILSITAPSCLGNRDDGERCSALYHRCPASASLFLVTCTAKTHAFSLGQAPDGKVTAMFHRDCILHVLCAAARVFFGIFQNCIPACMGPPLRLETLLAWQLPADKCQHQRKFSPRDAARQHPSPAARQRPASAALLTRLSPLRSVSRVVSRVDKASCSSPPAA